MSNRMMLFLIVVACCAPAYHVFAVSFNGGYIPPVERPRIVCIGDSNTKRPPVDSYCALSTFQPSNAGKPGTDSVEWSTGTLFDDQVLPLNDANNPFDACTIMVGGADMLLEPQTAVLDFKENIRLVGEKCRDLNIPVMILHGPLADQAGVNDVLIASYAAALVDLAGATAGFEYGITMNELKPDLSWDDNVHINQSSQADVAVLVDAIIDGILY